MPARRDARAEVQSAFGHQPPLQLSLVAWLEDVPSHREALGHRGRSGRDRQDLRVGTPDLRSMSRSLDSLPAREQLARERSTRFVVSQECVGPRKQVDDPLLTRSPGGQGPMHGIEESGLFAVVCFLCVEEKEHSPLTSRNLSSNQAQAVLIHLAHDAR